MEKSVHIFKYCLFGIIVVCSPLCRPNQIVELSLCSLIVHVFAYVCYNSEHTFKPCTV